MDFLLLRCRRHLFASVMNKLMCVYGQRPDRLQLLSRPPGAAVTLLLQANKKSLLLMFGGGGQLI